VHGLPSRSRRPHNGNQHIRKGGESVKIRNKKVTQGIRIKAVGLTTEEREEMVKTLKNIECKRRRENRPRLSYTYQLQ
jgi:ribosome recycling factor